MSDDHHEVAPNPDYDGPAQHCLPPEVRPGIVQTIYFTLLMIFLAVGAAIMGVALL